MQKESDGLRSVNAPYGCPGGLNARPGRAVKDATDRDFTGVASGETGCGQHPDPQPRERTRRGPAQIGRTIRTGGIVGGKHADGHDVTIGIGPVAQPLGLFPMPCSLS